MGLVCLFMGFIRALAGFYRRSGIKEGAKKLDKSSNRDLEKLKKGFISVGGGLEKDVVMVSIFRTNTRVQECRGEGEGFGQKGL